MKMTNSRMRSAMDDQEASRASGVSSAVRITNQQTQAINPEVVGHSERREPRILFRELYLRHAAEKCHELERQ